jgi:hypothetical protein
MPHAVVATFLVAHGLITTAIGFGSITNPNPAAMAMPSWMAWWPGPFGRSWLLETLNVGSGPAVLGGLVWLVAGLALVAGGLGWFGVSALHDLRITLLVGGAALSLVALALYFHPFYLIAVGINLAIIVLLWARLGAAGVAS